MYPPSLPQLSSSVLENAAAVFPTSLPDASMAASTALVSNTLFQIATIAVTSFPTLVTSASLNNDYLDPTSTSAMTSSVTESSSDAQENTGECQLLGPFAILVQAALGVLALLSLVFKRWRERPQRPVKIWAFDASKQVFGSVLLHLANLFMSMLSSGEFQASIAKVAASTVGAGLDDDGYQPNPCSFYLLNLAIDTTVGIPILILILRVLTVGASYTPLARPAESIQSGNYGTPPKATWWLKQSLIYFIGLLGMKACVFILFQLCPWIIHAGDWALRWTEGNEAIQITFVMFVFPLIMNAMQYYIIDTFIKKKSSPESEEHSGDQDSTNGEHDGLMPDDDHGHSIEDDDACKGTVRIKTGGKPKSKRIRSYDPDKDGEIATPVGESSSGTPIDEGMADEATKQRPAEL